MSLQLHEYNITRNKNGCEIEVFSEWSLGHILLTARHAACSEPNAQAPRRASVVVSDRAPEAMKLPLASTPSERVSLRCRRFTTAHLAKKAAPGACGSQTASALELDGSSLRATFEIWSASLVLSCAFGGAVAGARRCELSASPVSSCAPVFYIKKFMQSASAGYEAARPSGSHIVFYVLRHSGKSRHKVNVHHLW